MTQQHRAFSDSQPIDPITIATDYFSLDCLSVTFDMLRDRQPSLALICQNLLAEARQEYGNNYEDRLVLVDLDVQLVSEIVTALSEAADQSVNEGMLSKDEMIRVHQALLDWLLYAQTFLPSNER